MVVFLTRRIIVSLLLALGVATMVFVLVNVLPGDAALLMLAGGEGIADEQAVAALRHKLGLDLPLPTRYLRWLRDLFSGQLGASFLTGRPVTLELQLRFPRSVELICFATVLGVAVGVPLGVLAATRRGTLLDVGATVLGLVGVCAPIFVVGLFLVLVFSLWLHLLPVISYVPPSQSIVGHLRGAIAPSVALSAAILGISTRMTRSCLLEVLSEDFIRTARAKGLSERAVLYKHALRNSMIPVVAALGVQMGTLLGGSVIAETVFVWPGVSSLLVDAVYRRDYPIIQGVMLVLSVMFILANLLVEVVSAWLDPRIRTRA